MGVAGAFHAGANAITVVQAGGTTDALLTSGFIWVGTRIRGATNIVGAGIQVIAIVVLFALHALVFRAIAETRFIAVPVVDAGVASAIVLAEQLRIGGAGLTD
jgi:hypothetical protein